MVMGSNVTPYVIPPPARHPVLWHSWFHLMLPLKMRQIKPDLFFSPEFYLTGAKNIPQIPVFHDIAYEHYPKDIARFASWHCRTFSPKYAEKAAHILTVSEFSKNDIIRQYGTAADKISVVYNGASSGFKPMEEAEKERIRAIYAAGNPYFHFVGTIQPRKNLENLLRAFDQFKTQTPSAVKLLLVGRKGWQYAGAMETYETMQHKEDVIFTGFVPDEELNGIYAASLALCYVPYFEGFGIPILEAMQSETAVICSDAASMPEVAGEAAIKVDPYSPEKIAQAMMELWKYPASRAALIEAGKQQREKFSWKRTYSLVWEEIARFL